MYRNITYGLLLICLLISVRSVIMPTIADENTYLKISLKILQGKFYQDDSATSLSPLIPVLLALFHIPKLELFNVLCMKFLNLGFMVLGFRYCYKFFREHLNLDNLITCCILLLFASNHQTLSWTTRVYPESIAVFSFWAFLFYVIKPLSITNLYKVLLFFVLLFFTRYVFAVLGVLVLWYSYNLLIKQINTTHIFRVLLISLCFSLPVLFWIKYMYFIESTVTTDVSYFHRFKGENPILFNIKCGLGLEQSSEVNKVNGLPAFASLFIPITGYRNFLVSILLLVAALGPYLLHLKNKVTNTMLVAVTVVMLGYVFAGTGFSRYWLFLIPIYVYGFYLLMKRLKINDRWFVLLAIIISSLSIINELRLTIKILGRYIL